MWNTYCLSGEQNLGARTLFSAYDPIMSSLWSFSAAQSLAHVHVHMRTHTHIHIHHPEYHM